MSKLVLTDAAEIQLILALRGPKVALVAPAPLPKARTFATKKDRLSGFGFHCPKCLRNDLRVAPVAGRSFHDKDTKGNTEVCDLR